MQAKCLIPSLVAVALVAAAPSSQSSDKPLRFVAELAGNVDGENETLTLEVTFHGKRPRPSQVEEALRNCLEAAVALHPDQDIAASAWYSDSAGTSDRQKLTLADGADGLIYVAKDRVTRSTGGGDASANEGATHGVDLSAILSDPSVVTACESVPQERVSSLVRVASEDPGLKRRKILITMRAWCKDNDMKIDRNVRPCLSAILKAVTEGGRGGSLVPADLPAAIARGEKAYGQRGCVRCHQSNGGGGRRGPSLIDKEWVHCDGSVAGIRAVLVSGVPRSKLKDASRPFAMNPIKSLEPGGQDLTDLAVYVHSLSRK